MKRQKKELLDTLKADNYKLGGVVEQADIGAVKDLETNNYGTKTIMQFLTAEGEQKQVFLNSYSVNNLIDAFGEEDKRWVGETITIVCEEEPKFKKKMLIVKPYKAKEEKV